MSLTLQGIAPASSSRHASQRVCAAPVLPARSRQALRRCIRVRAEDPGKVVREFSEETGKQIESAKKTVAEGRPKDNVSDDMKRRMRNEYVGLGGSPNEPLKVNYFVVISVAIASLAVLSKLAGYI